MCNFTVSVKFGLSYLPGWHRGSEGQRRAGSASQGLYPADWTWSPPAIFCPPSVCPSPSASSPLCPPHLSVCLVAPIPVIQVSSTQMSSPLNPLQFSCQQQGRWSPASKRCQSSKSWLHAMDWPSAKTIVITSKRCNYKSPLYPMA